MTKKSSRSRKNHPPPKAQPDKPETALSPRLLELLSLYASSPQGQATLQFLNVESKQNKLRVIFDPTLDPNSYRGQYYPSTHIIALNPHVPQSILLSTLEHEIAHHRQNRHRLIREPTITILHHLITHAMTDENVIWRAITQYVLPYARMIEYDAFGRQMLYLHDFTQSAPSREAVLTSYHNGTLDSISALFIGEALKLDPTPCRLYYAGAAFVKKYWGDTYESQALRMLATELKIIKLSGLPTPSFEDSCIFDFHPLDLYAKRFDDPLMQTIAQNENFKTAFNHLLYPRLTRESSLTLEAIVLDIKATVLAHHKITEPAKKPRGLSLKKMLTS